MFLDGLDGDHKRAAAHLIAWCHLAPDNITKELHMADRPSDDAYLARKLQSLQKLCNKNTTPHTRAGTIQNMYFVVFYLELDFVPRKFDSLLDNTFKTAADEHFGATDTTTNTT